MKSYDAVVVGGGPAGATAALYLVRSGLGVAMLEKGAVGGQILSTSEIDNYPGFPKGVKGWELADLLDEHLNAYTIDRIQAEVSTVEPAAEGGFLINRAEGESLHARSVLLCSGARYRKLGVADEARFTGKGVSYCAVCDGNFYRGLNVAVVGGGNSALEESLYLARIVNKVYLIHRRDAFRGAKIYQDKIAAMPEKIELVTSSIVTHLEGKDTLEAVGVQSVHGGDIRRIPVEGLFLFVGTEPSNSFIPASVQCDPAGFVHTDAEMRTNIPGIFAAGDIRSKHCRQVSAAVGDGATAATSAISYLEQLHA